MHALLRFSLLSCEAQGHVNDVVTSTPPCVPVDIFRVSMRILTKKDLSGFLSKIFCEYHSLKLLQTNSFYGKKDCNKVCKKFR